MRGSFYLMQQNHFFPLPEIPDPQFIKIYACPRGFTIAIAAVPCGFVAAGIHRLIQQVDNELAAGIVDG